MVFDSKQFQVKKSEVAIAKWLGSKDDDTLAELLKLFRRELWKGQLQINYVGNGGINDVIFTEKPSPMRVTEDKEDTSY